MSFERDKSTSILFDDIVISGRILVQSCHKTHESVIAREYRRRDSACVGVNIILGVISNVKDTDPGSLLTHRRCLCNALERRTIFGHFAIITHRTGPSARDYMQFPDASPFVFRRSFDYPINFLLFALCSSLMWTAQIYLGIYNSSLLHLCNSC